MKLFLMALCLAAGTVTASLSAAEQGPSYANEDIDWGVSPTKDMTTIYHAKTPTMVPGAKTVKTVELKALLAQSDLPLVFDVLNGEVSARVVITGAIFLGFDGGDGRVYGAEKARFAKMLETITGGNRDKVLVFYCLNSECWLSYNAANRAVGE